MSLRRSLSQKSGTRFPHAAGHRFDIGETSRNPSPENPNQEYGRARFIHLSNSGVDSVTGSYGLLSEKDHTLDSSTFHTSFPQLRAEAGSLLGVRPTWGPSSESPTKTLNGSSRKTLGWMGNVRRALGSVRKAEDVARSYSVSPEIVAASQGSASPSPTKGYRSLQDDGAVGPDSGFPRRALSASSTILRRKQGAKDWGITKRSSAESTNFTRRTPDGSAALVGAESGDGRSSISPDLIDYDYDDDEEWDVEAAAEGRLVQVTFTIPKEKLRVVNAGIGDENDEEANNTVDDRNLMKSNASGSHGNERNVGTSQSPGEEQV
jgi:hypothetical protein